MIKRTKKSFTNQLWRWKSIWVMIMFIGFLCVLPMVSAWSTNQLAKSNGWREFNNLAANRETITTGSLKNYMSNVSGTVSLWIKSKGYSSAGYIFSALRSSPLDSRFYIYEYSNNKTYAQIGDKLIGTSSTLTKGRWYYITLTWNNGNMILYLDGTSQATGSYAGFNTTSGWDTSPKIGYSSSISVDYFNGSIDEIRVYNRTLTPAQVLEINNSGTNANYSINSSELVLWYSMDDNLIDLSGKGNNGTNSYSIYNYTYNLNAMNSSENITWTEYNNITRYLKIPSSVNILTSASFNYTSPILMNATGLVGYWAFDENTGTTSKDEVYGNNATLINSAWNTGIINYGSNTSGIERSFIAINNTNKYNFTGTPGFSLSIWANFKRLNPSAANPIINKYSGGVANQEWFLNILANGNIHAGFSNSTVTGTTSFDCSQTPVINTWYHYVITRNITTVDIWVNGTRCNTTTTSGNIVNILGANNTIRLGLMKDSPGYNHNDTSNATFDEIGIWNRTLTSSEISNLYENGNGLPYSTISSEYASSNFIINIAETIYTKTNLLEIINSYLTPSYLFGSNYIIPFIFHLDTTGILNILNLHFSSNEIIVNSHDYNSTTYETSSESFILNMSYDASSWTSISAYLNYNGTSYIGTKSGTGSNIYFTKTIDMPLISSGTIKNIFWSVLLTNSTATNNYNTSLVTQTISPILFGTCNTTLNIKFLNLTYYDESNGNKINATIDTSTFTYWLGSGTINKSYSYINTTTANLTRFCFSPSDRVLHQSSSIQYSNIDYPQRKFSLTEDLTNISTLKNLPLLFVSVGQYVTFQVINLAEQAIIGAYSTATLASSLIYSGFTDTAGAITFWLNPNSEYVFIFTKSGFNDYSTTLSPTQSSYTIQMGSSATSTAKDYSIGIVYSINPIIQYLENNTDYTFNFTISSTYWNLDNFGFELTNSTDTIGSVSSSTSTGGTVTLDANTENNTFIVMNYYWTIEGTQQNATRVWFVSDLSGNNWSIWTFFTDLKNYTAQGILGLSSFGLAIILFFGLFAFVGIMSYKFGLSSPAAITTIIFSSVLFLDVGLSLIPNPVGAIPHFPTFFVGLIFAGVLFKEVTT